MVNTKIKKVTEYLAGDIEELKDVVRELISWDGSLEHLDVHYNGEDFFNTYFAGNPMEAVRAATYGDYSFTDDYVRFDGYGNLESLNEYIYEEELENNIDDIVDNLMDKWYHLSLSSELKELLEEEEEEEEDEE